jgi:hypothetical protein
MGLGFASGDGNIGEASGDGSGGSGETLTGVAEGERMGLSASATSDGETGVEHPARRHRHSAIYRSRFMVPLLTAKTKNRVALKTRFPGDRILIIRQYYTIPGSI